MQDGIPWADPWSFATIYVVPYEFAGPLATASGFVLQGAGGRHYLVTNYHVATGRHPSTRQPIDRAGHVPDRLLLPLLRRTEPELRSLWVPVVVHLFDDDYRPTWIEHPRYGPAFDVVVIPFIPPPYTRCVSIDPAAGDNVEIFMGSNVSIIGFPHGLSGPALSAIWKTGAIATEPNLLVDGQDYFWVDANTRPGMSGGPVIARRLGSFLTVQGSVAIANNPVDRLLGVYAGRALDAADMTLGRVWRWRGVAEILQAAELRPIEKFAPLGTIGHHPEAIMSKVMNAQATIVLTGPTGPIVNVIHVATLLGQVATLDERFGASLDRIKLAARIAAACESAAAGAQIELPSGAAALLAECLRTPQGWGYPKGSHQILDMIEQTVRDLESSVEAAS